MLLLPKPSLMPPRLPVVQVLPCPRFPMADTAPVMSRTTTLSFFPSTPLPERETAAFRYQCHQPEQTLLYRIIEQCYPLFLDHLVAQDKTLPEYVA